VRVSCAVSICCARQWLLGRRTKRRRPPSVFVRLLLFFAVDKPSRRVDSCFASSVILLQNRTDLQVPTAYRSTTNSPSDRQQTVGGVCRMVRDRPMKILYMTSGFSDRLIVQFCRQLLAFPPIPHGDDWFESPYDTRQNSLLF